MSPIHLPINSHTLYIASDSCFGDTTFVAKVSAGLSGIPFCKALEESHGFGGRKFSFLESIFWPASFEIENIFVAPSLFFAALGKSSHMEFVANTIENCVRATFRLIMEESPLVTTMEEVVTGIILVPVIISIVALLVALPIFFLMILFDVLLLPIKLTGTFVRMLYLLYRRFDGSRCRLTPHFSYLSMERNIVHPASTTGRRPPEKILQQLLERERVFCIEHTHRTDSVKKYWAYLSDQPWYTKPYRKFSSSIGELNELVSRLADHNIVNIRIPEEP